MRPLLLCVAVAAVMPTLHGCKSASGDGSGVKEEALEPTDVDAPVRTAYATEPSAVIAAAFSTQIPPALAPSDTSMRHAKVNCFRAPGAAAACDILGYWNASGAYQAYTFTRPFASPLADALASADAAAANLEIEVLCSYYANAGTGGSSTTCAWSRRTEAAPRPTQPVNGGNAGGAPAPGSGTGASYAQDASTTIAPYLVQAVPGANRRQGSFSLRGKFKCFRMSPGQDATCEMLGHFNDQGRYQEFTFTRPFQSPVSAAIGTADVNARSLDLEVTCAVTVDASNALTASSCSFRR